jgi:acyl-CoA dehydrogenase
MIGGQFTYEIALEDCRVPRPPTFGERGRGSPQCSFACRHDGPDGCMVHRDGEPSARNDGRVRALSAQHSAKVSPIGRPSSGGSPMAHAKVRAARLMTYEAAWKLDHGRDVRTDVSMVKVYATEMAWEILDNAPCRLSERWA